MMTRYGITQKWTLKGKPARAMKRKSADEHDMTKWMAADGKLPNDVAI